ncbi:MAG TPA: HigA family addiction module antitoxin [bacterium]|nr:HigA family addiction module antitoxin [bacterium]
MTKKPVKPGPYYPPVAIPPGFTIEVILSDRGWTQAELARRMGRPIQTVNEIVKGKKEITADTAIELSRVLGSPVSFWLNLEANHRENVARLERLKAEEGEVKKTSNFPYAEMVRYGLVPPTRVLRERFEHVLAFLSVACFDALESNLPVVFRKTGKLPVSFEKLAVWLQWGELKMQRLKLGRFNKTKLQSSLNEIRSLTLEKPDSFVPKLEKIGEETGVAFLFVPEFRGLPVTGVTRWINGNPLVQVNLRYKTNDHLWFTVFHEIGHVLNSQKKQVFIDIKGEDNKSADEEKADEFACRVFVPKGVFEELLSLPRISEALVMRYSRKLGIAPGILVGMLQHEGKLPHSHLNGLKEKYTWEIAHSA